MRTVTICAYRRPDYLLEVLNSLAVARSYCPDYTDIDPIIGIDQGACDETLAVAKLASKNVIVWPEHLGVSEHPRRLIQYAFMECSDLNLHLEDDTVLSPDALRLLMRFERRSVEEICISLHSFSKNVEDPRLIKRRADFGVWGWAVLRWSWQHWFAPHWNHKRNGKLGWDWSVSHLMSRHQLCAWSPVLSRIHNIGRENGEHQTPEGYDQEFAGQVWAGIEDIQETNQFMFDPTEPERKEWIYGD